MTSRSIVLAACLAAACSGDDGSSDSSGTGTATASTSVGSSSGGSTGGGSALPTDDSADAIRAFVDAMGYAGAGWTAETTAPRVASDAISPHDRVRVYFNAELIASQKAGKGGLATPHDVDSMTVKEFYDGSDVLVGVGVMLMADGNSDFTYWCWGPADVCSTGEPENTADSPIYGVGLNVPCGSCHAGGVYTIFP